MKPKAILIVGPTGAGKSPLGNYSEKYHNFAHFDFGDQLRKIALGENQIFSKEEQSFVKTMLEEKSLLPEDKFYLVEKLLKDFIKANNGKRIVLNGFPRAPYQAEQIKGLLEIDELILLKASDDVIYERISLRKNGQGEDHSNRGDDKREDVAFKLQLYREKIFPLVEWCRERNILIREISVEGDSTARSLAQALF